MEPLTLTTPSLLFSAVSLVMLAYTNRFLSYAQVVRSLKSDYDIRPSVEMAAQIHNLQIRLRMIRTMQVLGISSLLLSLLSMLSLFFSIYQIGVIAFILALCSLTISLVLSIAEILISTRALDLHLKELVRKPPSTL